MAVRAPVTQAAGAGTEGVSAPERGADDTTRRLVNAAAAVFAEKGYDGAGVAEIARRAGLTTGAIYSRYTGKAELLAAAIEASVPEQIEQLFAGAAGAGHALELLQAVGETLVSREPIGRSDLLLEAVVAARRDPEVALVVSDAIRCGKARWAELIDAAKTSGELPADLDTDAVVHFVQAVGLGFIVYDTVGVSHPDPEPWRALVAQLISSLSPTSTTSSPPAPPAAPPDRSTQ